MRRKDKRPGAEMFMVCYRGGKEIGVSGGVSTGKGGQRSIQG